MLNPQRPCGNTNPISEWVDVGFQGWERVADDFATQQRVLCNRRYYNLLIVFTLSLVGNGSWIINQELTCLLEVTNQAFQWNCRYYLEPWGRYWPHTPIHTITKCIHTHNQTHQCRYSLWYLAIILAPQCGHQSWWAGFFCEEASASAEPAKRTARFSSPLATVTTEVYSSVFQIILFLLISLQVA